MKSNIFKCEFFCKLKTQVSTKINDIDIELDTPKEEIWRKGGLSLNIANVDFYHNAEEEYGGIILYTKEGYTYIMKTTVEEFENFLGI